MMKTSQNGAEPFEGQTDIFCKVFLGRLSTALAQSLQGASAVIHSVISLGSASRLEFRVLAFLPKPCKCLTPVGAILF